MPSEQLRFVLESIASIAGFAALVATALELQRARRADAREFLFHAYEKFNDIHEHRIIVEQLELNSFDDFRREFSDDRARESLVTMYSFWDLLTRTIRDRAIDTKSATEHFGRVFMTYYVKYSPFQHEWRKIEGDSDWFEDFDWFAEEYFRLRPGDWEAFQKRLSYPK